MAVMAKQCASNRPIYISNLHFIRFTSMPCLLQDEIRSKGYVSYEDWNNRIIIATTGLYSTEIEVSLISYSLFGLVSFLLFLCGS